MTSPTHSPVLTCAGIGSTLSHPLSSTSALGQSSILTALAGSSSSEQRKGRCSLWGSSELHHQNSRHKSMQPGGTRIGATQPGDGGWDTSQRLCLPPLHSWHYPVTLPAHFWHALGVALRWQNYASAGLVQLMGTVAHARRACFLCRSSDPNCAVDTPFSTFAIARIQCKSPVPAQCSLMLAPTVSLGSQEKEHRQIKALDLHVFLGQGVMKTARGTHTLHQGYLHYALSSENAFFFMTS